MVHGQLVGPEGVEGFARHPGRLHSHHPANSIALEQTFRLHLILIFDEIPLIHQFFINCAIYDDSIPPGISSNLTV